MTAIGFALVSLCVLLAWLDRNGTLPEWLQAVVGAGLIGGSLLLIAGISSTLWRIAA